MEDVLHCIFCGYDLRGSDAEGVCPECGKAVAESRRQAEAFYHPDPRWVSQVLSGMSLALLAMILLIGFFLCQIIENLAFEVPPHEPVLTKFRLAVVLLVATICFWVGIRRLMHREPGIRPSRREYYRCIFVQAVLYLGTAGMLFQAALLSKFFDRFTDDQRRFYETMERIAPSFVLTGLSFCFYFAFHRVENLFVQLYREKEKHPLHVSICVHDASGTRHHTHMYFP